MVGALVEEARDILANSRPEVSGARGRPARERRDRHGIRRYRSGTPSTIGLTTVMSVSIVSMS
jgi:hypothetical protein